MRKGKRRRRRAHERQKSKPKTYEEPKHKEEVIPKPKRSNKGVLDILIYICGALALIGGLCIGYLGVSGGLHNQRILALWILYISLFFVLTGAFLYFHQSLKKSLAEEPEKERPLLTVEGAALNKLQDGTGYVGVTVRNSGQSVARNATVHTTVHGLPVKEDTGCPEPQKGPLETMSSVGLIGVGERRIAGTGIVLTAEQMAFIERQETNLYVYMVSDYEGTKGRYSLEFYARYNPRTRSFNECQNHNITN